MFVWVLTCILCCSPINSQQQTTLTQPPSLETSVFQIVTNTSIVNITTRVTFVQNFTYDPGVFVSLVSVNKLVALSASTIQQSIKSISAVDFTHQANVEMIAASLSYQFIKLQSIYLAFDYPTYSFIQLHDSLITLPVSLLNNQFLKIGYIPAPVINTTGPLGVGMGLIPSTPSPALNSTHTYSLNVLLSGYNNLVLLGNPSLYIDAIQYDLDYYLLNVITKNLTVIQLQVLRILIDTTDMQNAVTGVSSLICSSGTIVHLSDPLAIQNNGSPDFLPFAILYGIKGWNGLNFSLSSFVYLFNNTSPRVQVNIGYILFQTSTCPTSSLYVASQNLCYTRSAAFYYQLTPATMAPCPAECYTCVGPLSTQCKSCVQGWNRKYVAGRCVCIPGFYSTGSPICKNCTQAIAGCYTCNSATNCLTCLPGCIAINFSPIYCDCPNNIQTNYSYNCPVNYYFQFDKNTCICKPQTYQYAINICFPCDTGCYTCLNFTYCTLCINTFVLINNSCIYFTKNYALLGQGVTLSTPYNRCLKWDKYGINCIIKCKKYYYNSNCYVACPVGTFNVSFPWLTCQPCKLNCLMCFNFTVCYKCQPTYYYFNRSTFACSACSQFCMTCVNSSYCTKCEADYLMVNNSCSRVALAQLNCSSYCDYCIVADWCLACKIQYYLNITDHRCYQCASNRNFGMTQSGKCTEICGDGVVVFTECDDGNLISGDGCSANCTIQNGYICEVISSQSYCWRKHTGIKWQIIPTFGANQFTLLLQSNSNLQHTKQSLKCGFNHQLVSTKVNKDKAQWIINFKETIIMIQNKNDAKNKKNFAGVNTFNRCYLDIDGIVTYTIVINTSPELLFIDYQNSLSSYTQNSTLKMICKISVLVILGLGLLGIMPLNVFAGLRVLMLVLSTYLDYYKLPINSFMPLSTIKNLLLMSNQAKSSNIIQFEREYYFQVVWKLAVLYVGLFLLHDWVMRGVKKLCSRSEWKYLTKLAQHIQDNKSLVYQSIYVSYQGVLYTYILKILLHFNQTDVKLLFFTFLHVLFIILTKVHFYLTVSTQFEKKDPFVYSMISDQFQNVAVAFLGTLSNANTSYAPVVIILFSIYNIYSLSSNTSSQKQDKIAFQFRFTNHIAVWHYGINLVILISLQILKCACSWRGVADLDLESYQSLGSLLGIIISFTVIALIMLNLIMIVFLGVNRLCEVKMEDNQQVDAATVDNISGQASVVE